MPWSTSTRENCSPQTEGKLDFKSGECFLDESMQAETAPTAVSLEPNPYLLRFRRPLSIFVHLALFALAQVLAFALRFEFDVPFEYRVLAPPWLLVNLGLRSLSFAWLGLFSGMWRYTGARDLVALFKAIGLSTLIFALYLVVGSQHSYPRSILVIDWLLTIILVGGVRFGIRSLWQFAAAVAQGKKGDKHRILVVGAGNAGEMLVREMLRAHSGRYVPVGFVDDDKNKQGVRIHGIRVLGTLVDVPSLVLEERIDEVVLAIPSSSGREMRRIVDACKPSGVPLRTIPGFDQLIDGRVTVNQLRSVAIEDLLGRAPVTLDMASISTLLNGSVVMVTGAGGSIGSELCRQIARFEPERLLLIERSENALFEVHRELIRKFPAVEFVPCVADICDRRRVSTIFKQHRPSVVLHAAAHKHVPMMELNPAEAFKNNVGGTQVLADVAHECGVERFVMISTDKAVNPTSLMGASKRIAELYVQGLSARSKTQFVAVRFGNVLGSAGSVVPIFKEQIIAGGPVTVTDPEMRRYFMTIPEASQLVLQAATMGRGGEIFVLDMGSPVKIVDLARDLISLSGLVPGKDIEIKFTGLRPGEKLFEELSTADESAVKTLHPSIFIGRLATRPLEEVQNVISKLLVEPERMPLPELIAHVRVLVPELQRSEEQGAIALH